MDTKKPVIIIATVKSWNLHNFSKYAHVFDSYEVVLISDRQQLTYNHVRLYDPVYIFFPHWSWIIPPEIYKNFECIVFHMTDLPYGRGGSPLQNLILNKHYHTKISALRVIEEIDAGPLYYQVPVDISIGSAEEIFTKISEIIFSQMIPFVLSKGSCPIPQKGAPVVFKRRKPSQSELDIDRCKTLDDVYDYIRMLDAEGYPLAFMLWSGFKVEFCNVHRRSEFLIGSFKISLSSNASKTKNEGKI